MDKVGGSFALFYGYVGLVGLALYLVLRWFKAGVPLASVWCVYGESRWVGVGGGMVQRRVGREWVATWPADVHL